jgi:hypothetical protein
MQRGVTNPHGHDHVDVRVRHAVSLEPVVRPANPTFQRGKPRTHTALSVVEERVAVAREGGGTSTERKGPPAGRTGSAGGKLCAEVAATLLGGADIREDERQQLVVQYTRADQSHWRNDEAFLHELRGALRHAARTHAADVRMMCAHGRVPADGAVDLDGLHQCQVGKVGPAVIGIVEEIDVAGMRIPGAYRMHRLRHRAEVHRDVRRLRHHAAACIEERG